MAALDKLAGLPPAKLALAVRTLRERAGGIDVLNAEPLAIVGMACRFPGGADTPEAYWRMLSAGTDAVTEVPPERWDIDAIYDPTPGTPGKTTSRWGSFLDGIDRFDPDFFGIAPREAASLDPQQRLVLEVAWEALERAGIPPRSLAGSATGMFLGIATLEYGETRKDPARIDPYFGTGNNASVAAGRLSYLLGLNGPAVAVDTACSASLTAVHLACQSLRAGESDIALAGGVNIILSPDGAIYFSQLGAMAANGRCKTFDAAADGYVRGEGCGMVVLKTLSRALADGDPVLALIRGSAINQDGRSNGLTAPNGRAQEAVIRRALEAGGVAASAVGYVECHGTGTPLGDTIETAALARAYRPYAGEGPLLLGAVKTNFGHLESAAGIAGLIKAVLCLQHGEVPPNLNFATANPLIDWSGNRLAVPTRQTGWPSDGPRFAGVSAFGFSGSNAHVVLEEASLARPAAEVPSHGPALLLLSAEDEAALADTAAAWQRWLAAQSPARDVHPIAATAAQRRSRHHVRLAVIGANAGELAAALDVARAGDPPGIRAEDGLRLVMVFPGQGGQWAGMGRGLAALPEARATLEACAAAFAPHVAWSLVDMLALDAARFDALPVDVVQPVLFALQLALARQIIAWGLRVDAVVGHSMGEVAAACVAGSLTLDDAARVICTRSRLVAAMPGQSGAMAVLEMDAATAEATIAPYGDALSVAALNGPRTTLVAGRPDAVTSLVATLESTGVFARMVKVDYASHSAQMDPLLGPLAEALTGIAPRSGTLALHSTVTGRVIDGAALGRDYWAANLREPVRLWPVVAGLATTAPTVFLEISPHPVLVPALEEGLMALGGTPRVTGTLCRGAPDVDQLLAALGRLAAWGLEPDWRAVQGSHPVVPDLPTYPWRRSRYWLDAAEPRTSDQPATSAAHPLLGTRLDLPEPETDAAYSATLRTETPGWLADHRVGGAVVLPGTAYLEMALAAAGTGAVGDVALKRLLVLPERQSIPVHTSLRATASGDRRLAIQAKGAAGWVLHAEATVLSARPGPEPARVPAEIAARCPTPLAAENYYAAAAATGVDLGPAFRVLSDIRVGSGEVLARLAPAPGLDTGAYRAHPAILDGGLQALAIAVLSGLDGDGPHVPVAVERVSAYGAIASAQWIHARALDPACAGEGPAGDVALLDAAGRVLVDLTGVRFQRLDAAADAELANALFRLDWRDLPMPTTPTPTGLWLLIGGGDVAASLATALTRECCTVRHASDVDAAVASGAHADAGLAGIAHLSALDALPDLATLSAEGLMQAQQAGAGSLVRLCAALSGAGSAAPRLWTIFPGGPLHAAMAGIMRSAAQELPQLSPGFIELDGPPDPASLATLLRSEAPDRQLRLAGSLARTARFVRLDRDAAATIAHQAPLTDSAAGPVLITGGFGGIGLVLAEAMADAGARELVLVGRTPPGADAGQRVAALEARGVRVLCRALDITDEVAVGALIAEHPPRGVIHAAGILDDVPLGRMTPERLAAVLAPKVAGAWALHRALAGRPLDFLVFMSSTAAIFGGPAQANYAAANAFLDTLALWRRGNGLPALSLNWSAWTGVGLAAASDTRGARLAAQGIGGIAPGRGAAILRRLLARPAATLDPVLAVLPLDVARWMGAYPDVARDPLFADLLPKGIEEAEPVARRMSLPHGAEGRAILLRSVIGHLATATGRAPASIEARTPLASLGLDSLMALDVRNRLQRDHALTLSATLLWRFPTAAGLAEHLADQISGETGPAEAEPAPVPDDELDRLPVEGLARLLAAELEQD